MRRFAFSSLFLSLGIHILLLTACTTQAANTAASDWIDFIQFDGIRYQEPMYPDMIGRPLTDHDLDSVFATVQFQVIGNTDASYQVKDGDAALLAAGTPVYTIKGYNPLFRLAARQGNTIILFEAETNPRAQRGSDLLDLDTKVSSISIHSFANIRTQLTTITNQERVNTLVKMLLEAPVNQQAQSADYIATIRQQDNNINQVIPSPTEAPADEPLVSHDVYYVLFHLNDGTIVYRPFDMRTHELGRGIWVPDTFGQILLQSLSTATPSPSVTP